MTKLDWNVYEKTAIEAASDGIVMLKNDDVLPFEKGTKIAVFGRTQNFYYKSGTGSGGMVNVDRVVGIMDALAEEEDLIVDEALAGIYSQWEKENPADMGAGWAKEPWSQIEMELDEEVVKRASAENDAAVIIIGRTAGEDRDNTDEKGAYRLSVIEEDMIEKVTSQFERTVLLFNVGGLMDMSSPVIGDVSAILYVWQGGMIGGYGVSRVLSGKVNPSGHLTDTIAEKIEDYPSADNFNDEKKVVYAEDIFVGYRYFDTFDKKVLYPFGYGLSYTDFDIKVKSVNIENGNIHICVVVKNIGKRSGKEVVQIYVGAPKGEISKPKKVLGAFFKTRELEPGETFEKKVKIDRYTYASFDDKPGRSTSYSYVLEKGNYTIYVGENVRDAEAIGTFSMGENVIVERLESHLGPVEEFDRMRVSAEGMPEFEKVPLSDHKEAELIEREKPERLVAENTGNSEGAEASTKLEDVAEGKISLEEFVATLTEEELVVMVHGEGMGSPRVTAGTAAAYAGVKDSLVEKGVPAVCCSDGPSGMRIDSGAKAFSLPIGTMLASTFDVELIEKLYTLTGLEMRANKIDNILGPGMNIHRHPLNGRNFEYFSEDPLVTGCMAAAMTKGLKNSGACGTAKHFAANNREQGRTIIDSVVSEKALREIYLKGFEIAVRAGSLDSIMTTYGKLNGGYTAGRYELNTSILRGEWGFEGIVMTDWWAFIAAYGCEGTTTDYASMVKAGNDLYMVCNEVEKNNDNLREGLASGSLDIAWLQRCALHICKQIMSTYAFERICGNAEEVEVVNRKSSGVQIDFSKIKYIEITEDEVTINPREYTLGDEDYGFTIAQDGRYLYEMEVDFVSELPETAQIPVTFISQNVVSGVVTFNGTGGETKTMTKRVCVLPKYSTVRIHMGGRGLDMRRISFKRLQSIEGAGLTVETDVKRDMTFC